MAHWCLAGCDSCAGWLEQLPGELRGLRGALPGMAKCRQIRSEQPTATTAVPGQHRIGGGAVCHLQSDAAKVAGSDGEGILLRGWGPVCFGFAACASETTAAWM